MAITRNAGATYFIPSENEWYKAAYYKGGGTNAGYWLYPTQSNTAPSNVLSATGTNNANYHGTRRATPIRANYLTPVGTFAASPGPYGTFDQGGDVWRVERGDLPARLSQVAWRVIRLALLERHGHRPLLASTQPQTSTLAMRASAWQVFLSPAASPCCLSAPSACLATLGDGVGSCAPCILLGFVIVLATSAAQADVFNMGGTRNADGTWTGLASLETVPVGDPGNAADTAAHSGNSAGQGAVAYSYNIGKYEVTAGQYTRVPQRRGRNRHLRAVQHEHVEQ